MLEAQKFLIGAFRGVLKIFVIRIPSLKGINFRNKFVYFSYNQRLVYHFGVENLSSTSQTLITLVDCQTKRLKSNC